MFLVDRTNWIWKLLQHAQLHEIVSIIPPLHIIFVLLVPNMFFAQISAGPLQGEILIVRIDLADEVFNVDPHEHSPQSEDDGRLHLLLYAITIDRFDLVLS